MSFEKFDLLLKLHRHTYMNYFIKVVPASYKEFKPSNSLSKEIIIPISEPHATITNIKWWPCCRYILPIYRLKNGYRGFPVARWGEACHQSCHQSSGPRTQVVEWRNDTYKLSSALHMCAMAPAGPSPNM